MFGWVLGDKKENGQISMERSFLVDAKISIKEVDERLKGMDPKILFLTKGNRLLASITDGDVLRYLMKHGDRETSAMVAANQSPYFETQAVSARKYLQKHSNLKAIPIVDNRLEIKDVVILDAAINPRLSVPVVINAGGKGTRLDPYTRILPKALIPVGSTPIIEHIMRLFLDWGCDDFHIIVNHKRELIKAYFVENKNHYHITWYDEYEPLGTGGGLSMVKGVFGNTFFFTNCDTIVQTDFRCLMDKHNKQQHMISVVAALKTLPIPYGVIEAGEHGEIEHFQEKPEYSFLTNTGLYLLEPEVVNHIGEGVAVDFPEVIAQEMAKGGHVGVLPVREDEWLDMGQLEELEKMRERLELMEECRP